MDEGILVALIRASMRPVFDPQELATNVRTLAHDPVAAWQEFWREQWDALGLSDHTRLARSQGFVITTRQFRNFGSRYHDLRREVRRGNWCIPTPGTLSPVVINSSDTTATARRRRHALAASGQALAREAAVIGGRSGAIVHGLPTLAIPDLPELTAPVVTTGRHRAGHVRPARLLGDEISEWYGAPVETVPRILVDLGRHNRFDAIMALDAAWRSGLVVPGQLDAALERASGWPGVRQARRVLALGDGRAESPLESVLRLRLHEDDFPQPELQVPVVDAARGTTYFVDILLAEQGLIIEADGREKYTEDALWKEKQRETRLRAMGFRVERVLWSDVFRYWPETSSRLRAQLRAA